MKKLKVIDQSQCKNCLTCELACAGAFYKDRKPYSDIACIRVTQKDDGSIKINTCVQCGKCAKACEAGAITQNAKGVYMINKKLCVGCGKCVEVCPFGLIAKPEDKEVPTKCIACGICAKACPMDVLEVIEK